ncbi:MAG: putative transporter, permease component [Candidatus Saccharibacteria bacterium]|nr:putative transporter, permease component [Candidatus Saccharibacteria bacterium]
MKPLIAWELRQRKMYLLWWTLGTVLIVALLLGIYPSIRSQAASFNQVINQLPTSLRDLKTGGGATDVTSPIGYLNAQLYYITLPLLQIVMSVGLGSSLLARDEHSRTLELLLSRPISRGKLLLAKAVSGILLVAGVTVVSLLATIALASAVDIHIPIGNIINASLYAALFSLSFGAIAFAFAAMGGRWQRASMAVAVCISFGGYLLASLSGLSHYIQTPAKFLPYHYYTPTSILHGQGVGGLDVYLVIVFAAAAVVSWLGFRSRDIE